MIVWLTLFVGYLQDPVADHWTLVAPENARASVEMPGEATGTSRVMSPVPGQQIEVHLFVFQNERETNFVFGYHDQANPPANNREINRILDGGVRGAVARTLGELESAEAIRVSRYPARAFTFTCIRGETAEEAQPLQCAGRLILVNNRLYQMLYIAHEDKFDAQEAERFFKSFKLQAAPRGKQDQQRVDD